MVRYCWWCGSPHANRLPWFRPFRLGEGTVKSRISRVLSRPGLRDRTHAAVHARDHGLL
ncbi:hypothetical protein ABT224_25860 [Streptomyces sp. NPDC001584]|uniref:hypothetical protein n=1 Tax=Streptomyces sp. NPDC001584 TaxID=3154521 RepID=UPI003318CCF3